MKKVHHCYQMYDVYEELHNFMNISQYSLDFSFINHSLLKLKEEQTFLERKNITKLIFEVGFIKLLKKYVRIRGEVEK